MEEHSAEVQSEKKLLGSWGRIIYCSTAWTQGPMILGRLVRAHTVGPTPEVLFGRDGVEPGICSPNQLLGGAAVAGPGATLGAAQFNIFEDSESYICST